MTRLSEIERQVYLKKILTWHEQRGMDIEHQILTEPVMHYIERLEARQQDLEQACILALSIFVNQEDIDKFPVLHQELKTVLAQHEREDAR